MPEKRLIPRNLEKELTKWLKRPEILAIKGPRQSGKTTLLKKLEVKLKREESRAGVVYINLEDRDRLDQFTKDPIRFIESFSPRKSKRTFFLFDEYHYVPEAGQSLKLLYDSFTPQVKFIITGSSSLELTAQTGRWLVGRVFSFNLFPVSFGEYLNFKNLRLYNIWQEKNNELRDFIEGKSQKVREEEVFSSEIQVHYSDYLRYGGYPAVVTAEDEETKQQILKNIEDTYLRRDIIELLKVESVDKYRRLTQLIAGQTGQLANYQQLSQDSGLYFKKLKHYLSILEETYVISRLRPYFNNLTTEIKKNPKLYFLDSGLRNWLVRNFNMIDIRMDRGQLAESVTNSLLYYSYSEEWQLNFWRTTNGAEIDFILSKGIKSPIPAEVKYSSFNKPRVSRSYRNFIRAYSPERGLILTKDYWDQIQIGKTKVVFVPAWVL
ncbi:hypothetical protein B5M47_00635 [candidate division CPR3 bacterium 4484_211]|uniref:AAA+ ATPase domain-containing protein n=1 Tax=candidate division CPR3 bacterium 4484_211 TaxID=1968527 RepID=A0A1W9P144_UNCC3|nr:MAG: hypothetical protein B5M47_00635 [candidate division CPR3 bacterium 4484_211]